MGIIGLHKAIFVLEIVLLSPLILCDLTTPKESLELSHFPSDFLFGTSSSAYQYEGAYLTDGKGLNNWDVYTHKSGNNIIDGSSGDVAVDQYHLYLEDVNLMSTLGVNSYRFSISWARILPKGRFSDVNQAGINFYNKLIDALLLKGIEPFVTIHHFDIPHELEERYEGWLSPELREDFLYFAEICFKSFGDRVKNWVTFNEPNLIIILGFRFGTYPPCRCSRPFGNCSNGNSEKEPFIAAHNMILSHAAAVYTYRTKYQKEQRGRIGIVLHAPWFEPISNSTADIAAAERAQTFFLKWILDPIIFGKYPVEMENTLGSLLPKFSTSDKEKLKMGLDFIGLNHYDSFYVKDCIYSPCEPGLGVTWTEGSYLETSERNGVPIGETTPLDWLNAYPRGMEEILLYVMKIYHKPMIVTENGYGTLDYPNTTIEELIDDAKRVEYMSSYLDALLRAKRKGADVRGYFVWSFLDNFEWLYGYTARFGLYLVDHLTLNRTRKTSATWYQNFIATQTQDLNRAKI
ncbi:hypothetical protein UlMin_011335 [Ulmus minor]